MTVGHLVVPEGQHDDRGQVDDASPEQAQEIQRGVVGPVHVLDDQHHRAGRAASSANTASNTASRSAPAATAAASGPDVPRAASRSGPNERGRDQVVAGAAQHPRACGQRRERGATRLVLPIPASPDTSATLPRPSGGGGEELRQGGELGLPLEQAHSGRVSEQDRREARDLGEADLARTRGRAGWLKPLT